MEITLSAELQALKVSLLAINPNLVIKDILSASGENSFVSPTLNIHTNSLFHMLRIRHLYDTTYGVTIIGNGFQTYIGEQKEYTVLKLAKTIFL